MCNKKILIIVYDDTNDKLNLNMGDQIWNEKKNEENTTAHIFNYGPTRHLPTDPDGSYSEIIIAAHGRFFKSRAPQEAAELMQEDCEHKEYLNHRHIGGYPLSKNAELLIKLLRTYKGVKTITYYSCESACDVTSMGFTKKTVNVNQKTNNRKNNKTIKKKKKEPNKEKRETTVLMSEFSTIQALKMIEKNHIKTISNIKYIVAKMYEKMKKDDELLGGKEKREIKIVGINGVGIYKKFAGEKGFRLLAYSQEHHEKYLKEESGFDRKYVFGKKKDHFINHLITLEKTK